MNPSKAISFSFFVLCFLIKNFFALEYVSLDGQWTVTDANSTINIVGQVPGGIYTDLQKNGKLDDPYYRFNDVNYRWVSYTSWNYTKNFQIMPEYLNNNKINLVCDGLDTVAELFINKNKIGSSDNMFVRYIYDVKSVLQSGNNLIEVVFESPVAYALEQYNIHLFEKYAVPPICPEPVQNGECHANFIRKIQSQFSWDWGPAFPSVGIWKDIRLEAYNSVILRDIIVSVYQGNNAWKLNFQMFWETANENIINGNLKISIDAKELYNKEITLVPDEQFATQTNITVFVPQEFDIQTWWPNGLGEQALYNITTVFTPKDSDEMTSKSVKIGFRTVELIQEPIPNAQGLTFYFLINGVKTFMKGSNWIPADSFPERITPEYTRRLLLSAKEAHMNVLRVWGGGMYETDIFYDYADEMGIMIWQDMMYACSMYPATDSFLENVQQEITHQIKRLQHHPSILLWSGNNENEAAFVDNWYGTKSKYEVFKEDYIKLYVDTIQPLAAKLDPNRPFLLSSPSNGIETEKEGGIAENPSSHLFGDVHFYDYAKDSWNWTIYPVPRFISEYGIQSWTSLETLSGVSVPDDWHIYSKFSDHRQHHLFGNVEMINSIGMHFGISNDCNITDYCFKPENEFSNFIYLSQITQAMGIKTASEHYLRKQSELIGDEGLTMGALYWQLNDIWQCASWASIEFGGKWKILHYYAKNFFAPLIASPFENDGIFLVSVVADASVSVSHLCLDVYVYQWKNFTPYHSFNMTFYKKPQSADILFKEDTNSLMDSSNCPGRPYCFIYVTLTDMNSSEVLSSNFYFLTPFNLVHGLYDPHITVTVQNGSCSTFNSECTFDLLIESDKIAPFVWIEAKGIAGYFSDNGFLLVSPKKDIQFHSWELITSNQLTKQLSVKSLIDVYNTAKNINYIS